MITSKSGLIYETRRESLIFGDVTIELESLRDIDQTIDRLFDLYQSEGKTELFEEMCPYFGTLWPAGKVLAHHLATEPFPSEKRILEIGCGLAVPSLVLCKRHVMQRTTGRAVASGEDDGLVIAATDVHVDVPTFLDRNRNLNALIEPRFVGLDWREVDASMGCWDLILASDVLYDKTQPTSLMAFLERALAQGGRALVADPGRTYVQGFFDEARQRGFQVKTFGLFGVLIGELTRDMLS